MSIVILAYIYCLDCSCFLALCTGVCNSIRCVFCVSDCIMGGCAGKEENPYPHFTVTNINDQHRLVHSGIMFVTETHLIYIDKKSHEKWEWPLKFLRRYGCEGFVFSFEAGRKCPSGEGLYAFNCKKANALFNRVAQNISQGNLEPTEPDQPERNADIPFLPKQPLPQHAASASTLPTPLPNGHIRLSSTSIQPMSLPSGPPPLPPTPPPSNQAPNRTGLGAPQYTHLEFEKGRENKTLPLQGDKVNYTEIDMTKTNEISRLVRIKDDFQSNGGITRRQTIGMVNNKKKGKGGSRSSSCSSSSSLNPEQVRFRSLDEGSKGGTRGSAPDIRNPSQKKMSPPALPSTAEALVETDPASPHHKSTSFINEPNYLNISVGNGTATTEDIHTYSNMTIGATPTPGQPPPTEQNYANISVGTEEHNYTNIAVGTGDTVTEVLPPNPSPQPDLEHNYTNITIGSGVTTPITPPLPVDTEHNYTNITVGGDPEDQSNYQNLIPGQGLVSSTPIASPTVPDIPGSDHQRGRSVSAINATPTPGMTSKTSTLPTIKDGGGANMATYIELDMSSSNPPAAGSYAELEISNSHNLSLVTPSTDPKTRQRSVSAVTPTTSTPTTTNNDGILYQQLNFTEMEALRSLVLTRQNVEKAGADAPPSHTALDSDKDKKSKSKK